MAKYRNVLKETENVTSKLRGFRTKNQSVVACEQIEKRLSHFYPTDIVESDSVHTFPFLIEFFFNNAISLLLFTHPNEFYKHSIIFSHSNRSQQQPQSIKVSQAENGAAALKINRSHNIYPSAY